MMYLQYWWQLLLYAVGCYVIGTVNFSVILSTRVKHRDIRSMGSGNPGTTNMMRSFGLPMGVLTLLADMSKAAVCVAAGLLLFGAEAGLARVAGYLGGMSCTVGHIFPLWLKFRGGKGFACSVATFLILDPVFTAIALAVGLVVLAITDRMSVFALLYFFAQIVYHCLTLLPLQNYAVLAFAAVQCGIGIWAHRSNIVRLLQGKENPTGVRTALFGKKPPKNEAEQHDETKSAK